VPRQRRRFGHRDARCERDRDERVSEVVQADRLAFVAVEARRVTRRVDGSQRVPPRLRLAPGRREDERVGVDAPEVFARLPAAVLAELTRERRKQPHRCRAGR